MDESNDPLGVGTCTRTEAPVPVDTAELLWPVACVTVSQCHCLHRKDTNEAAEDRTAGNDIQGFYTEKAEKRTRKQDRPDRGVCEMMVSARKLPDSETGTG
ncbi:hypothetical protein POM88_010350 [Heracleum sosnowskyi]|uniref:Uncharacterized protein n=1 Tax=Heracleum sosnowskyi TaxID=360622 RepID=A0AAD8MZV3_9APIA|nr:hypothetical protein POM88_010350 [Heracleum sosnowskyi]